MSNVYLYKFNNYYNRIIVKYDTLEEYGEPIIRCLNTNFIPGDSVNTSHIFNASEILEDADYCIVTDASGNIESRWFVMHHERTRANQYKVDLLRDVVAEFRDEIFNSTAYIRRAMLPSDNKLIYNSEGFSFNQIKQKEDLLFDKTNTPWIVGYIAPNVTELAGANVVFQGDDVPLTNYDELIEFSSNPLTVVDSVNYIQTDVSTTATTGGTNKYTKYTYNIPMNSNTTVTASTTVSGTNRTYLVQSTTESGVVANEFNNVMANQEELAKSYIANYYTGYSTTNTYNQYNGRIVKNGDNYYKVKVEKSSTENVMLELRKLDNPSNSIWQNFTNLLLRNQYLSTISISRYNEYVNYTRTKYTLSLEPIQYGDVSITFGGGQRILQDAPYYMFAMKYTPENYQLAIAINTSNGQQKIYDIQLLPYCPVQDYFIGSDPNITTLTEHKDYEIIHLPNNQIDYLFWCNKSVFTFDIDYSIPITNIKVQNECDMYRLCSPNGNGQFEFNAAKNGGITKINVDCTYRPYDPYIHLNPNFGNLYGQDFNDFRGLILNGDFSIPALNDKWVEYTVNNKNYQNIFNREIQSLELQNQWAFAGDIFKAITGTISGGLTGAIGGATYGGGLGAGIGGGVGGLLSAGGGIADVIGNKILRDDQLNLKKDLFNMNIQNIQAIPNSVSKTGCLTNNNKLVPYIEYYTCTEIEKTILENKIKYQGMNVGCMGTIGEYVVIGGGINNPQYIEADIIQIELDEDYNVTMEVVNTMKGGVRIA